MSILVLPRWLPVHILRYSLSWLVGRLAFLFFNLLQQSRQLSASHGEKKKRKNKNKNLYRHHQPMKPAIIAAKPPYEEPSPIPPFPQGPLHYPSPKFPPHRPLFSMNFLSSMTCHLHPNQTLLLCILPSPPTPQRKLDSSLATKATQTPSSASMSETVIFASRDGMFFS